MMLYIALRCVVFIVRLCPFWFLYPISHGVAWVAFKCGFRRHTVLKNLQIAFPHKSQAELLEIAQGVYRNFFDVGVVEMLKFFTLSKKAMKKHLIEDAVSRQWLDQAYASGQDVILVLGHYANWEWPLSLDCNHKSICFYKPFKHKKLNAFIKRNRERFSTVLESVKGSNPREVFGKNFNRPVLYTLVADKQRMKSQDRSRVTTVNFLGKEQPFLVGPAVYAKRKNAMLLYVHIEKIKLGQYVMSYQCITDKPEDMSVEEMTQSWVTQLEQQIISHPEQWFWFWALTQR